jgi:hypothetical protein
MVGMRGCYLTPFLILELCSAFGAHLILLMQLSLVMECQISCIISEHQRRKLKRDWLLKYGPLYCIDSA